MWPENPRKLRESSAKALTSWDGRPPHSIVPAVIWRSRCLAVPIEIAVEARLLRSGACCWGWSGGRGGEGGGGGRGDGRHAALIKFRDSHMAGGKQMFQYMCLPGNTGNSFQHFPRKFVNVYFRHVDAAKEKRHIAKGSRKRWRKGRQNRTQIIGVSATAHLLDLHLLEFNSMLFPILFSINPNFRRLQSFQRLKQRHGGMEEGQLVDGNSWLQSRPKIVWGTGYIYICFIGSQMPSVDILTCHWKSPFFP